MPQFKISTHKKREIIDITPKVEDIVAKSKVRSGVCTVYVPHATAAVIINENADPNVCTDIIDALEKMIPEGVWLHDRIDGNASAHIKASILGPSESIPVEDGKLQLGTWQSIMLADFDGPRERKVIVKVVSQIM